MLKMKIRSFIYMVGFFSFVTGTRIKDYLTCPEEFENIHRSCFRFVNEKKSWQQAQDFCKTLDSNLAALEALQEKISVNDVIEEKYAKDTTFWFGYQRRNGKGGRRSKENIWEWLPNHEVVDERVIPWFRKTYAKKPSSYCGGIQFTRKPSAGTKSTLLLHNDRCSKQRFFVCEHKPLRRFPQTTPDIPTRLVTTDQTKHVSVTTSATFTVQTSDESQEVSLTTQAIRPQQTIEETQHVFSTSTPRPIKGTSDENQDVLLSTSTTRPQPTSDELQDVSAISSTPTTKPSSFATTTPTSIKDDKEATRDTEQLDLEEIAEPSSVVAPCQGFGGSPEDSALYRSFLRSAIRANEVKTHYYMKVTKIYAEAIEAQMVYYSSLQAKLDLELAATRDRTQ